MIEFVISDIKISLFRPEDRIIHQGGINTNIFFISRGSVIVNVKNEKYKIKHVDTLESENYFGDISVIFKCKATSTVLAEDYCTLAKLGHMKFYDLA